MTTVMTIPTNMDMTIETAKTKFSIPEDFQNQKQ